MPIFDPLGTHTPSLSEDTVHRAQMVAHVVLGLEDLAALRTGGWLHLLAVHHAQVFAQVGAQDLLPARGALHARSCNPQKLPGFNIGWLNRWIELYGNVRYLPV